jgi:hypothetical protein
MPEQHVKLMQGIGLSQEQIDAVEKLPADQLKDWKADDLVTAAKGNFKNQFLNDPEFLNSIPEDKVPEATKKKIESGQYARFQNEILETAKKNLGLEDKDLADMTDEEKKSIKKMVTKVAEKYLGKKGTTQGLQEMQQTVQKLTADLEKKDSDWEGKLNGELEKVNGAASSRMIKALTKVELSSLDKIKLNVPPAYITDPLLAKLQSKYTIVLSDNDELDIKQKDNKNLDVLENNKKVTFSQALRKLVLEDKVGAEITDDEGEEGKKKKVIINKDGGGGNEPIELPGYIAQRVDNNKKLEPKSE